MMLGGGGAAWLVGAALAGSPGFAPGADSVAFAVPAPEGGDSSGTDFAGAPEYAVAGGRFRFLWTPGVLWVRAVVADDVRQADVTGDDSDVTYRDDGVELMIDGAPGQTDPDAASVGHVIVSAAGGVYDTRGLGPDALLAPEYVTATVSDSFEGAGFTVIARVALAELAPGAAAGTVLGFDFGVNDRDVAGDPPVQLDWAGLEQYNEPACWGRLQLAGAGDPAVCPGGFDADGSRCLDGGCVAAPGRSRCCDGAWLLAGGVALALSAAARSKRERARRSAPR